METPAILPRTEARKPTLRPRAQARSQGRSLAGTGRGTAIAPCARLAMLVTPRSRAPVRPRHAPRTLAKTPNAQASNAPTRTHAPLRTLLRQVACQVGSARLVSTAAPDGKRFPSPPRVSVAPSCIPSDPNFTE